MAMKCWPILFVDLVNRADVRMIESGGGKGLALEAFAGRGIVFHFRGKKLQRDAAPQLEVFRFVDHAHPAAAELRQDAIVRDGLTDHAPIFQAGPAAKSNP
jgi:hypothetical protein